MHKYVVFVILKLQIKTFLLIYVTIFDYLRKIKENVLVIT